MYIYIYIPIYLYIHTCIYIYRYILYTIYIYIYDSNFLNMHCWTVTHHHLVHLFQEWQYILRKGQSHQCLQLILRINVVSSCLLHSEVAYNVKNCYFHPLHVADSLNSHKDMVIDIADTAAVHPSQGKCLSNCDPSTDHNQTMIGCMVYQQAQGH